MGAYFMVHRVHVVVHEERVLGLDHRARVNPPSERIREGIHRDELDILQRAHRLTHLILPAQTVGRA